MDAGKKRQASYSESAIHQAVRRDSIQHPLVLYPSAVGVLGGLAVGILGASVPLLAIAGVGATVGLGTLATNYFFRKDFFRNVYIRKIHAEIVRERERRLERLKQGLNEVESERGLSQLGRLEEKFALLQKVLGNKLQQGELTYERYLCISEQVYLSALDNLQSIVDRLESVKAIDEEFLESRLSELDERDQKFAVEIASLKERLSLFQQQIEETDDLLGLNEGAMTKIDSTTMALSKITTSKGHATVDMETAMRELEKMASRAQDYSV
ncbi:hypothetical protein A9Q99_07465 [Gammaproteobacteria bacterium 45_16_T64]|nr:hypothetical protein A9Q99_07465 [Gammaproteobacteria bacterium 45_16_T64]